jgi:aldehyde dehydrogenase (NAD+)
MGVPNASDADVADAVACLRYYAGMADKIHGQTTDAFGGSKLALTLHQPIGVCGQM